MVSSSLSLTGSRKTYPAAYSELLNHTLNKITCNDPGIRALLEEVAGTNIITDICQLAEQFSGFEPVPKFFQIKGSNIGIPEGSPRMW